MKPTQTKVYVIKDIMNNINKIIALNIKEYCLRYNTQLYSMMRLQFWNSKEWWSHSFVAIIYKSTLIWNLTTW